MSSHYLQAPAAVDEYLKRHPNRETLTSEPVVAMHYRPGTGWKRHGWRKRISRSYARTLRREGVTNVALDIDGHGRLADFTITELLRQPRQAVATPTSRQEPA